MDDSKLWIIRSYEQGLDPTGSGPTVVTAFEKKIPSLACDYGIILCNSKVRIIQVVIIALSKWGCCDTISSCQLCIMSAMYHVTMSSCQLCCDIIMSPTLHYPLYSTQIPTSF